MSIVAQSIAELLDRDLDRLSNEIQSYTNEENIWLVNGEITNSAGNLALHLCGNLQFGDKDMSTVFFLVHLQGHLNYHLGQINYHRRLLDK